LEATDRRTGSRQYRTLGAEVRRERDAHRACADWLAELEESGMQAEIGWQAANERFLNERLAGHAEGYRNQWRTAARKIKAFVTEHGEPLGYSMDTLAVWHFDADFLSRWRAWLQAQDPPLSKSSVNSYLRILGIAMRWWGKMFPGYRAPDVEMLTGIPASVSLTISTEAMERMLTATAGVVGDEYRKGWRWLIRGLFWSGLRRTEALKLRWDDPTGRAFHLRHLDHARRHPVYVISAEDDKGGRDREFPVAPEFAEMLRKVPADKRKGFVFRPRLSRGRASASSVTHVLGWIAEAARISVGVDPAGSPIWATPQDFRRTFGRRWAPRVPAVVLQEMMRHRSIETTRKYYLGEEAQRTADEVWRSYEAVTGAGACNQSANRRPRAKKRE
jgi:integrase